MLQRSPLNPTQLLLLPCVRQSYTALSTAHLLEMGLCIHICAYFILFMHMSSLSQALLFCTLCNPGSLGQLMLSILKMISEETMQSQKYA